MRAYKIFRRLGSMLVSRSPARVKLFGTEEAVADVLRYDQGKMTKALPGSVGIFVYVCDDEQLQDLRTELAPYEELWEIKCAEPRRIFTRFKIAYEFFYIDEEVIARLKKPGVRARDFRDLLPEVVCDIESECWVTDWVIPIKLVAGKGEMANESL